jgi:hypothetical protein
MSGGAQQGGYNNMGYGDNTGAANVAMGNPAPSDILQQQPQQPQQPQPQYQYGNYYAQQQQYQQPQQQQQYQQPQQQQYQQPQQQQYGGFMNSMRQNSPYGQGK